MIKVRLIKYICYSISFILSLTLLCAQAYADTSFDSTFCNVSNLITGTSGKIIAGTVLVSMGVGFFVGKVSWGLLIASTMGVGVMFGAPTVVAALSGETLEECQQAASYTITRDGDNYYACPIGYSGENCGTCAIGYTGPDCSGCDTGYIGAQCDECDSSIGYSPYNGSCYQSCTVSGIAGTSISSVEPGSGSVPCNASANYAGSVPYICDSSFTPSGSCSCAGNYDLSSSCNACLPGYTIASGCSSCDAASYTNINGSCQLNCSVSGVTGIANGTTALPPHGSLTCDSSLGYHGSIDYTCSNGNFNTSDSCTSYTVSSCMSFINNSTATFTAPVGTWKSVSYAAYGMTSNCSNIPQTSLPGYNPPSNYGCGNTSPGGVTVAPNSASVISSLCVGQSTCSITVSSVPFMGFATDLCPGYPKYLQVKMKYGL